MQAHAVIVTAELQTANVAYFQRKPQLSGFSSYPDGAQSHLIRISGVLLYCQDKKYVSNFCKGSRIVQDVRMEGKWRYICFI
jgi:hypothetical protein